MGVYDFTTTADIAHATPIHAIKLTKILSKAQVMFPSWNNFNVSRLKVENVENPPQNPITRSGIQIDSLSLLNFTPPQIINPANIPVASTLAANTPAGVNVVSFDTTNPIAHLATLPAPPPMNIATTVPKLIVS